MSLALYTGNEATHWLFAAVYGPENVSSGASSDIRNATAVASAMVRQWGFSDKIGPVFHRDNDNTISPRKREMIESEIQRLIVEGQDRARRLLKTKEDELHKVELFPCLSIDNFVLTTSYSSQMLYSNTKRLTWKKSRRSSKGSPYEPWRNDCSKSCQLNPETPMPRNRHRFLNLALNLFHLYHSVRSFTSCFSIATPTSTQSFKLHSYIFAIPLSYEYGLIQRWCITLDKNDR